MQKKVGRSLSSGNEFLAYVDAIGHMDGTRRLLKWKPTSARYASQWWRLYVLTNQICDADETIE